MATRCLLIEDGKSLILIDTGFGNKQSEKFFSYYNLWGNYSIDNSLKKYGFTRNDITDVFFTHLHFDHCGGAIERKKNGTLSPEWNDIMRTPSGILTNNPLGHELYNTYIAPVVSKPDLSTIRDIFQDGDVGDPRVAGSSGY